MQKHNIMGNYTILIGVITMLLACSVEPKPINYGRDACHFCKMTIVDNQHAAEIITLKGKAFKYLKRFTPADEVSLTRYRIGLVMFSLPLLFGWLLPYLGHYFTFLNQQPVWQYVVGDMIFFASFFVLGGDFWDKFSGLFRHKVKVV